MTFSCGNLSPRLAVRVEAGAINPFAWQTLDLGRLDTTLRGRLGSECEIGDLLSPITPAGDRGVGLPDRPRAAPLGGRRPVGRRKMRRVPDAALVEIGADRVAPLAVEPGPTSVPACADVIAASPSANDNVSKAKSATKANGRSTLRDLFFLAILAATVYGAFYSGRLHAMQKVIVVPEITNAKSVLT